MSKPIAYYAHSMHLYGSKQEDRDVKLLESLGYSVINPGSTEIQVELEYWMKDNSEKEAMAFFKEYAEECDLLAYRCHVDLKIPSGVMQEIDWAIAYGNPVLELPTITQARRMTLEETREYLKYNGQR